MYFHLLGVNIFYHIKTRPEESEICKLVNYKLQECIILCLVVQILKTNQQKCYITDI